MTFYQIALYPPQQPQQKPSPWWQSLIWKEREREGGRHCQPDIEGGKSVLKLESKKYGWPWNEMKACDQQNNLHSWYIFNTCQSKPLLSLFQGCRLCHQLEERMRRLCLIRYKAVSSMKRSLSSPEQRFGLWQSNILLLQNYKTITRIIIITIIIISITDFRCEINLLVFVSQFTGVRIFSVVGRPFVLYSESSATKDSLWVWNQPTDHAPNTTNKLPVYI